MTSIVVGLIVVGIVLVVLSANQANEIVNALLDAARWLAGRSTTSSSSTGTS